MTIKDLEQYRQLHNEVKQLNRRLDELYSVTSAVVADTVKGSTHQSPYQEHIIPISGIGGRHMTTYARIRRLLENRTERLQKNILAVEEYIDTVSRSDIRQIIDYRYIQGLSWKATARRVYGYPSGDRARMAVTRFFAEI